MKNLKLKWDSFKDDFKKEFKSMYFWKKHYKEVDKIKVGDIVYLGDCESEVIEADETHLVVKTKCYRAKVSVKKQK